MSGYDEEKEATDAAMNYGDGVAAERARIRAAVAGLRIGNEAIADAREAWKATGDITRGAWDIGFKRGWDDAANEVLDIIDKP